MLLFSTLQKRKELSSLVQRITLQSSTRCWTWNGPVDKGYGKASAWKLGMAETKIHVIIWRITVGPIPAGKVLHHRCLNRRCCNPRHLIPLTPSEHSQLHAKLRRILPSEQTDQLVSRSPAEMAEMFSKEMCVPKRRVREHRERKRQRGPSN